MKLPSIALHVHHNASIAVMEKNEIKIVIEFERFINLKNASYEFFEPIHSREWILEEVYDYLKKEFGYVEYQKFIIGHGFKQFPIKYKEIIPSKEYIIDESHHPSHAYGAFYQSGFDDALVISFDGGANDGYFHIYKAEKNKNLNLIKSFGFDLGSHYHVLGSFCDEVKNYHVLTAAGKVLGLQSYGNVKQEWKQHIKKFFTHTPYWHELDRRKLELMNNLGLVFSNEKKLSGQDSYDLTKTGQDVFEELFFECVDDIIFNHDLPIVLAGGCALNIVLNTKIKEKYNREVFVGPNSTDCGLTVGLLCKHLNPTSKIDITYKGVGILDRHCLIEYVNNRNGYKADLNVMVNDLMSEKIIGVVQGNSEHGPRALGNRSIICSPIPKHMKDTLNLKVKHREWYRPFAPIVRLEDVSEYFDWEGESRWMNFCPKVKKEYVDLLPAITHVDGTARVQTVTREQNQLMYDLLTLFKNKTGIGVLVNTSFNLDGKPILSTYKDAFNVLDNTQLDHLYLDGFYFTK